MGDSDRMQICGGILETALDEIVTNINYVINIVLILLISSQLIIMN